MPTLKQIEANRRNALKGTGPKTQAGKAAVRLNSLRHGLRARTVVLPGEDPREFQQLCDDLEAEWQPHTRTEQFYLEQMAVAQWKLTRMQVGEADLFQGDTSAEKELQLLHRLWQAQHRLERSFARAQGELQRLQNSRVENAGIQADPEREVSAAPEAFEEMEDAGMSSVEISPAGYPLASPLPWPPIQTRDLIAKLCPSQGATPDVARDALG
jgi:hypothetical protein